MNSPLNYDNLLNSLIAFFIFINNEGWLNIMHSAIDSTSIDKQPILNNNN